MPLFADRIHKGFNDLSTKEAIPSWRQTEDPWEGLPDEYHRLVVEWQGHLYATLDFVSPESRDLGPSELAAPVPIPPGWELSPDYAIIAEQVCGKHPWGCKLLVTRTGASFTTSAWEGQPGSKISNWELLRTDDDLFGPRRCLPSRPSRILIRYPGDRDPNISAIVAGPATYATQTTQGHSDLLRALENGGIAQKSLENDADAAPKTQIEQMLSERCRAEQSRKPIRWNFVTQQQVMENCDRRAPGMFYDMEFPWNEAMLIEFGPEWLTKAFHTAGTLDKQNKVTKIIPEDKIKVTTGNNGGKFLFEVEYAHQEEGLHTKLFAKGPHPFEGKTKNDRLSTSVNKQPMDFYELQTHRLLEATLPVKMARYYFGDISNETTNWILITECIQYSREGIDFSAPSQGAAWLDPFNPDLVDEPAKTGGRRKPLPPMQIEEPYDKCADWNLRGDPFEYWLLLCKEGAKMAGMYKAGKLGDVITLGQNFDNWENRSLQSWGMNPRGVSGRDSKVVTGQLDAFIDFASGVGKVLFPEYVKTPEFQAKLRMTLITLNAYAAETMYWRHRNQDYIALTHQNLNVDNAFFWRDQDGKLKCGIIDWGNMGSKSMGFKIWWWLYCADYELLTEKIDTFIDCIVTNYSEAGGPQLDKDELKTMFIITGLEQLQMLAAATPQVYAMCPKKEWETIKNRYDPRIGENIDGKSTIRLYLQVMVTVCRMIEEWGADKTLFRWVTDYYCEEEGKPAKTRADCGDIFQPEGYDRPAEPPLPIGLLFPGQGSQYVNMLLDAQEMGPVKSMLAKAKEILGYNILQIMLEGPAETLEETRYCQPAMFIAGLAGLEKLRSQREEAVSRASVMAGLSLGEYTALCAAGVFTFEDGLRLVKLRGEAMQEAAAVGSQKMLSVAGIEKDELEALCSAAAAKCGSVCQIANLLFPGGAAVGGNEDAINELKARAQDAGALQAKILPTAGAFHTPLMQPAQEKLAAALDEMLPNMKSPRTTVWMNATAEPLRPGSKPEDVVKALKMQLCNTVYWDDSVRAIIADGVTEFYELGPQKQLLAMMKRIDQKMWKNTKNIQV